MKVTLGGDRIGSGSKMVADLKTYDRSTFNLSYKWRSTMAAGTLVPFMKEVLLPGDTFDVELSLDGKTHPTIGPLFGSYKIEAHVWQCPVRLYQAKLWQNITGIGKQMQNVKLPLVQLEAAQPTANGGPIDNQQMNPSAIFSYLDIRGLGKNDANNSPINRYVTRRFNAVPWLAYWDIYKNYYANKQEGIGAVLHTQIEALAQNISSVTITQPPAAAVPFPQGASGTTSWPYATNTVITFTGTAPMPRNEQILIYFTREQPRLLPDVFQSIVRTSTTITCSVPRAARVGNFYGWGYATNTVPINTAPSVVTFPLANLDTMRNTLLSGITHNNPIVFDKLYAEAPVSLALQSIIAADNINIQTSKMYSQEGLALKTYNSDLHNNWLAEEWAGNGPTSVSAITAVDTSSGEFTIDALILARKAYDVLMRINVSDGTYDAWLNAVYTHDRNSQMTTPVYEGGLIQELAFQEVISNAASISDEVAQPLGTLAGHGTMAGKNKGGKLVVKAHEIGYLMGIVSITPRIDYSQGNKWDTNLRTMDDFHKPGMDNIGFQELTTDGLGWWQTTLKQDFANNQPAYARVGYQPAWINYQTNLNKTLGNFADPLQQMYMTLNRRYEANTTNWTIRDLTTYIDPVKFNYIFAQTSRDAQNFWIQMDVKIIARRKMSAKYIPNL